MIELNIKNEIRMIPENFDELTEAQFVKYIEMIHTITDINEFKIKYLLYLLNLTPAFLNKYQFALEQIIGEVLEVIHFTEMSECSKIQIPIIKTKIGNFYGPADRLDSFTAEELDSANVLYDVAVETESIEDLANFVAVLYRPTLPHIQIGTPEWKGDYRMPYNSNNIKLHAKGLESVDYFILKAVMLNFQMIMNMYKNAPQYELIFKSGGSGSNEPTDWQRIYRSIVPDISNVDHLLQLPIYKVFDELVYLEEQREFMENQKK